MLARAHRLLGHPGLFPVLGLEDEFSKKSVSRLGWVYVVRRAEMEWLLRRRRTLLSFPCW